MVVIAPVPQWSQLVRINRVKCGHQVVRIRALYLFLLSAAKQSRLLFDYKWMRASLPGSNRSGRWPLREASTTGSPGRTRRPIRIATLSRRIACPSAGFLSAIDPLSLLPFRFSGYPASSGSEVLLTREKVSPLQVSPLVSRPALYITLSRFPTCAQRFRLDECHPNMM